MANALIRRKTTNVKPIPKPQLTVKEPKRSLGVEFRWSTSISQLHLLDLDNNNTSRKTPLSFASTSIRNSALSSYGKVSPISPRLPVIIDSKEKHKLSLSSDDDKSPSIQISPISLTYAQLHHAQLSPQTKKKSRSHTSLLPALDNNKRNSLSIHRANAPQDSSTNNPDKYVRLPISQLRRLHVSSKYIKEAKKLYFNPVTKVFVPRHAVVEMI